MYSELFQCECTHKTIHTFMVEFMVTMGKIVPPKIAKKYAYKPMDIITSSLDDISSRLLKCYTLEEMHNTFLTLTDNEQHLFMSSLWVFETEFGAVPDDTIICVPDDPKYYIKPFLHRLLTLETVLV